MPNEQDIHVLPTSADEGPSRYLSTRVDPASPPFSCAGDSVNQMRLTLQRSGERGRYRVYDRQPPTPGVDAELIGQFIVDGAGAVEWKALRSY